MSFNNRPNRPVKSEMYVRLVTENGLRQDTVKKFYNAVKKSAPEGILSAYEVSDETGMPKQSALVHRIDEEGKHEYEVPLLRNMTSSEVYKVVQNLNRQLNEGDFLFETSTFDENCCIAEDEEGLVMEGDVFERFAERLAERLHNKWMQERMDAGWRYGQTRCDESKTHPMIKPWNQLTESQRYIDYDLPKFFIDLLEEMGYLVVSKEEFNNLIQ